MRRLGKSGARWRGIVTTLAVFAALGLVAGRSGAQDPDSTARGRVTFRVYCQNCHGDTAKGNGRLAPIIKVPPADLTQLSRKNGGTFPVNRVYKVIDGRAEVLAHGDREMPIWGQAFVERSGNEDEVRGRIQQLIAYLESIQDQGTAARKGS